MIRKLKFVGIPVHDQDRALDFYLNTLGFTLVTDQPMGPPAKDGKPAQRWVEIRPPKGDCGIALFTPPGHEGRIGTFTGISLECDDLDKTCRDLAARGVEFPTPLTRQPWGSMAIMKDSEGNQIVLGESN